MTSSTPPPPPPPSNLIFEVPQANGGQPIHVVYLNAGQTAPGGNSDGAPSWGDFDKRLRDVEQAVSGINERFKHIPTKSELWKAVWTAAVSAPVILGFLWIIAKAVMRALGQPAH